MAGGRDLRESKREPMDLMPETGHQATDVTADLQES